MEKYDCQMANTALIVEKRFESIINNIQTIRGNRAERSCHLSGSLATYQCGEAENKAGYRSEWSKGGGGRWK